MLYSYCFALYSESCLNLQSQLMFIRFCYLSNNLSMICFCYMKLFLSRSWAVGVEEASVTILRCRQAKQEEGNFGNPRSVGLQICLHLILISCLPEFEMYVVLPGTSKNTKKITRKITVIGNNYNYEDCCFVVIYNLCVKTLLKSSNFVVLSCIE